jgi:hypothetical protein
VGTGVGTAVETSEADASWSRLNGAAIELKQSIPARRRQPRQMLCGIVMLVALVDRANAMTLTMDGSSTLL